MGYKLDTPKSQGPFVALPFVAFKCEHTGGKRKALTVVSSEIKQQKERKGEGDVKRHCTVYRRPREHEV